MLDILLLRDATGGNSNLVRESERRRYNDPAIVDQVIEADQVWRKTIFQWEATKKLANDCPRAIAAKKKAKEADGDTDVVPEAVMAKAQDGTIATADIDALCVRQIKVLSKFLSERAEQLGKDATLTEQQRDDLLHRIGNIVHESVPVDDDEDRGNTIVQTFGETPSKPLSHVDIMEKLGAMDCGKAVTAMSGGRSYVLRGGLVQLQVGLISYAMSFLAARGYTPFYPPLFLTKEAMGQVAQLSQFDDELYKVTGEGDDKYLIATSEQPIAAYHRGKWFNELPKAIKYAGMSTCFRKEAGSHGRDSLGIFRVHQFDKIEQFVVCSPYGNESWKLMEEMITCSEDFYKSLGIPYRVVNICSGALNNAAAKKYDLEGWFPGSGKFRELVSCSNCTDYQARRLNCRFGDNKRGTAAVNVKEHPHMLNSTLCAITRTMCAIAENYQTEEGVIIPEVLRPFMMGKDMLRYSEAADIVDQPSK
jgi:seryl-tRNA synthetase